MAKTIEAQIDSVLQLASLSDLEILVRGIGHRAFVELVKHDRHLMALFHGFRPDKIPWAQAPKKVAQDAENSIKKKEHLLLTWLHINQPICDRVREDVHAETFEEDVAKLLSSPSTNDPDLLYWALYVDEREEIISLVQTGILSSLFDEASPLRIRADRYQLLRKLENSSAEVEKLRDRIAEVEKQNKELVTDLKKAEQDQIRLQQKLGDALQHSKGNQELKAERQQNINQIERLQRDLAQEQLSSKDLRRQHQSEKSQHAAELNRKQQQITNLEQRLEQKKQDYSQLQEDYVQLEADYGQIEEDQKHIVLQNTELQSRKAELEQQVSDFSQEKQKLIQQLDEVRKAPKPAMPQPQKKESGRAQNDVTVPSPAVQMKITQQAWKQEIKQLEQHFAVAFTDKSNTTEASSGKKRWHDWQQWLQMESLLVHPLLIAPLPLPVEQKGEIERAQKLLNLRWFLLDWLKRNGIHGA